MKIPNLSLTELGQSKEAWICEGVMSKLRGVIFSVENTLLEKSEMNMDVFAEVERLITYLRSKGIEFAVLCNRHWTLIPSKKSLESVLKERWGEFPYFCSSQDRSIPQKPKPKAVSYVLDKMGWDSTEVVYIGSSVMDMRTAVNSDLLFLRAKWFANETEYGLPFDTPLDIARFIDTFCLRDHWWCMSIEDGDFRYYSLAPFSTYVERYSFYSQDARAAAKQGQGHPDFWLSALVTSVYFTGLHKEIDYITVYPGHKKGSGSPIMNDTLDLFGKCFRARYIPDLILRHTDAVKSQTAKQLGLVADHLNQLNTIHINPNPQKSPGVPYANSPLKPGKTVLLVDDFCTRGHSIESARAFLEQTKASVITVSWLKTINTDIKRLVPFQAFDPYKPWVFKSVMVAKEYPYKQHVSDHMAPNEIDKLFRAYEDWQWPE